MFRDLPRYAETKATGLAWAKVIPATWHVQRAKSVMGVIDIRSAAGEEELLTVSSSRGVIPRASAKVSMFQAESYKGHKLCWPNDLVINSLWAWGRGLGVAGHHGIVSTAYGVYRLRDQVLDPGFLHELVRSEPFQWELQVRSQGVWKSRLQITDDRWLDAPLLVPPPEEQAAIVKYLAHANARLDNAIAAKRRLIAFLKEQWEVRLARIVLGVGSAGEFRESGEPWIGRIPAHWTVEPLRARFRQDLGKMLSEKVTSGQYMRPYLRNTDVQWGRINTNDLPKMNITPQEESRYVARVGDVLVCEGGDVGRAAIWKGPHDIAYQKALHRLRPFDQSKNDVRYLVELLRIAKRAGAFSSGRVSTIEHLTGDQLRRHRFPWPPFEEQKAISDEIEEAGRSSRKTLDKVNREITLLQEFRTRLVADVVTGQVDVRAIAATLPDATTPVATSTNATTELDDRLQRLEEEEAE